MINKKFGLRVVPIRPKNNGIIFNGFQGIVICAMGGCRTGFDDIELSKWVWKDGLYYSVDHKVIPWDKTFAHSKKSGKYKVDFLYSEAKKFAKCNEEVALCDNLIAHLTLLENSWVHLRLGRKKEKK